MSSRRAFIGRLAGSMAGLALTRLFPSLLAGNLEGESHVVEVRDDGLVRAGHDVDHDRAFRLLNAAMKRLTRTDSDESAWRSLFHRQDKVGIKLSCLPGMPLSSCKGVVMAIVDGLGLAGVPADRIIIWERTGRELEAAGFNLSRTGVRVLGTDAWPGGGYSRDIEFAGSVGTCFSMIMEQVTAMINVPVLKDHDIAGLSAGMKNFYGAIYNPNKYHGNGCSPFVADLSTHRFIRDRLRLIVLDATRIQLHNGPAFVSRYADDYGGLVLGTDPVAVDSVGLNILERRRLSRGLKTLKDTGRSPRYLPEAAKRKLGHMEEDWIDHIIL